MAKYRLQMNCTAGSIPWYHDFVRGDHGSENFSAREYARTFLRSRDALPDCCMSVTLWKQSNFLIDADDEPQWQRVCDFVQKLVLENSET